MRKNEDEKQRDEIAELKRFHDKKKKEQKALKKLLEELNKKANNDNLKTNI